MKYSLDKIYHMDKSNYNKIFSDRFNNTDCVHLDLKIKDNSIFFLPDNDIYKLMLNIERVDKKVYMLFNELPKTALEQFAKKCLVNEIVLTNNIEGVTSTRREINSILLDLKANNRKQRFFGIVNKYNKLQDNKTIQIKSSIDIRNIYDDIFLFEIDKDDIPDGKIFRKQSVNILSESQKVIHTGIMPEDKIIETMDKAIDFLNDNKYDYLFRISAFHYLFGYIHPFYDGNGRTSRFISSYKLSKYLNPLIAYNLSSAIKNNISEYYKAFSTCNNILDKADITPFIQIFIGIISNAEEELYTSLQTSSKKLKKYKNIIPSLPNASNKNMTELYELLIQASLFSEEGLSIKEIKDDLNISYNTVKKKLELIPDFILQKNTQGKQILYNLDLNYLKQYLNAIL